MPKRPALVRVSGLSVPIRTKRAKRDEREEEKSDFNVVDEGVAKAGVGERLAKGAGFGQMADKVAQAPAEGWQARRRGLRRPPGAKDEARARSPWSGSAMAAVRVETAEEPAAKADAEGPGIEQRS